MTREEARKAAEVMMAYADGKKVEYNDTYDDGRWDEDHNPVFDWASLDYRIKKELTYRPFKDKEECWNEMLKHQPFGWTAINGTYEIIISVENDGVYYSQDPKIFKYNYVFEGKVTFADGTPFGIKEE